MIRTAFAALALALSCAAPAAAASSLEGLWDMQNGKAQVRIESCSSGLCGTLASMREPNDANGRPKLDKNNPDPSLRGKPVVGLSLLSGMKPDGADWAGNIYNPEDGETYVGRIVVSGADTLQLKGCVLGGLLCKTRLLTRIK